jgi:hypothetical protein
MRAPEQKEQAKGKAIHCEEFFPYPQLCSQIGPQTEFELSLEELRRNAAPLPESRLLLGEERSKGFRRGPAVYLLTQLL